MFWAKGLLALDPGYLRGCLQGSRRMHKAEKQHAPAARLSPVLVLTSSGVSTLPAACNTTIMYSICVLHCTGQCLPPRAPPLAGACALLGSSQGQVFPEGSGGTGRRTFSEPVAFMPLASSRQPIGELSQSNPPCPPPSLPFPLRLHVAR